MNEEPIKTACFRLEPNKSVVIQSYEWRASWENPKKMVLNEKVHHYKVWVARAVKSSN